MKMSWLINGKPGALDPADRGLAYGDGLFETMAVRDGSIRWLDHHLERLVDGCRQLAIPAPNLGTLHDEISRCASLAGKAVLKLIVTRGAGARGYRPADAPVPTRILGTAPWPTYPASNYTDGIEMQTCALRLGENPRLAGIKHLCRLEQVVAQIELKQFSGVDEGLLLDTSGFAVGGTSSNIFAVRGTDVVTPQISRCGVRGVMRKVVLGSCSMIGCRPRKADLDLTAIYEADELFVTNAVFGIWPVRRLDGNVYEIGEKTRELQDLLGYADGG